MAPAEAPPRLMPRVALPNTPIPANRGRVVIDTTVGAMRVSAKFDPTFTPPGGSTEKGLSGELCVTPCVVDLPVGRYRLFFSAMDYSEQSLGDRDDLVVAEGLTVYRRAPGRYRTPTAVDQVGPAAVMVAGGIAFALGSTSLAHNTGDPAAHDSSDLTATAGLLLLGSAVMIGGGIWAYDRSRATEQDGASTVWLMEPPATVTPGEP